jgi:hypothetical protein
MKAAGQMKWPGLVNDCKIPGNLPAACVAKKDEIQQKMSVSQHFSAVFFK